MSLLDWEEAVAIGPELLGAADVVLPGRDLVEPPHAAVRLDQLLQHTIQGKTVKRRRKAKERHSGVSD